MACLRRPLWWRKPVARGCVAPTSGSGDTPGQARPARQFRADLLRDESRAGVDATRRGTPPPSVPFRVPRAGLPHSSSDPKQQVMRVGHDSVQDAHIYPFFRFGDRVTLSALRGHVGRDGNHRAGAAREHTRKEASDEVASSVSHTIHAQGRNTGRSEGGRNRGLRRELWGWKGPAPDRSGKCAPTSLAPPEGRDGSWPFGPARGRPRSDTRVTSAPMSSAGRARLDS
jgi:hypothetical protein